MATLTLIGLYNYDNTLFDEMSLPTGISNSMVIPAILSRGGEFEVIYSDLDFLKSLIGFISQKWFYTFNKWYNALQIEYEPLYNYDRFEEWTDTNTGTDTGTVTSAGAETGSANNSSATTNSVNAYDDDTLVNESQVTGTQTTGTSNTSENTETRDLANTENGTHSGHMYGNIGVTTSQQMLQSELEIAEWNLYEHIADVFIKELCIPVY